MEDNIEKIRKDCWDKTLDAIGYGYIYQVKIKKINFWLRISKILGIVIPVFLGGILTSAYNSPEYISLAIWITSPIALFQLILSTILTINGADDNILKYSTKAAEYSVIENEFRQMARYPNSDEFEYLKKFEILIEREKGIGKANLEVSDREKRMGMRFGLRELSRKCVGCELIPLSMKSTNCEICGNF
jgi:mobilome CxxCx(11)CxxC protein